MFVIVLIALETPQVSYSAVSCHGVNVCNTRYECGVNDNVCPNDFRHLFSDDKKPYTDVQGNKIPCNTDPQGDCFDIDCKMLYGECGEWNCDKSGNCVLQKSSNWEDRCNNLIKTDKCKVLSRCDADTNYICEFVDAFGDCDNDQKCQNNQCVDNCVTGIPEDKQCCFCYRQCIIAISNHPEWNDGIEDNDELSCVTHGLATLQKCE